MSDLPRPVTVADKYLAAVFDELVGLRSMLEERPVPAKDDTVELREVQPDSEPTPIPEDFPGYLPLTKAGIIYLESIPTKGDALVEIPGIGAAIANRILTAQKL